MDLFPQTARHAKMFFDDSFYRARMLPEPNAEIVGRVYQKVDRFYGPFPDRPGCESFCDPLMISKSNAKCCN